MEKEDIEQIRKIQAVLTSIQNKVPVFFNLTLYKRYGLVYTTNKKAVNAQGNIINCGTNFLLTKKAKQYLNVVI